MVASDAGVIDETIFLVYLVKEKKIRQLFLLNMKSAPGTYAFVKTLVRLIEDNEKQPSPAAYEALLAYIKEGGAAWVDGTGLDGPLAFLKPVVEQLTVILNEAPNEEGWRRASFELSAPSGSTVKLLVVPVAPK